MKAPSKQAFNNHNSMEKKYVWKGLYFDTVEHVSVEHSSDGHTINGTITGEARGMALNVHYSLYAATDWTTQRVAVTVDAETSFWLSFQKNQQGRWIDIQGNILHDLDGCTDVDISMTPFTNTLTINRARLAEKASEETTVLYIDVEQQAYRPVKQRYTCVRQRFYQYENLDTGFTTIVETDADGIVIHYPDIWKRIYPIAPDAK